MAKQMIYNKNDNPAKNFMVIISEIRRMSRETNTPESKIMGDLAKDLENENVEGYKKELPDVTVTGLGTRGTKQLIAFLNKMKKDAEKREERIKKENDPETLAQKAIREEEKAKRKEEQKISTLWDQICHAVEKKSKKENRPVSKCWVGIKNSRFPKDSKRELSDTELRIKKMVEDETYYQEVKYFTHDFKFLALDSLAVHALFGNSYRKFSDMDSYERFCSLREKVNLREDENLGIQRLLMDDIIDETSRKILEERAKIIETQKSFTYVDSGEECR